MREGGGVGGTIWSKLKCKNQIIERQTIIGQLGNEGVKKKPSFLVGVFDKIRHYRFQFSNCTL